MSWVSTPEPVCSEETREETIELSIEERSRQIDSLAVGRVLPAPARRSVGPFVFFDHMGPAHLAAGDGLDVRPHPHIHLATVTYLFEGEVMHRDSLGSAQEIRPGAINWMTAGRGIVHSERTPPGPRATGPALHGLQLWVALPESHQDVEPSFVHHPEATLPTVREGGVTLRVLAGEAYGARAPVETLSPLFYVEAKLDAGAQLEVPPNYEERGIYVVSGAVACGASDIPPQTMAVLRPGAKMTLRATGPAHLVMIGGASLGPRYIWWNFVSSSKERIEEAARAWRAGEFPKVPGDEIEFIPLTEEPRFPRS